MNTEMDAWHTRIDRIRNKSTPVVDKMREARLNWFRYVKRKCANTPTKRCEIMTIVDIRKVDVIRRSFGRCD
ncbi:hypothetical protein H5410_020226 [Solanum commersonii]|uniref:Uncharacterized protein n=1 Tax=Solanum commersonii TaxID=4109 RepID=A0A9J5Z7U6_SOLCO|nr:hypothetical protein H5410_020226 [Solanum commersonii]